MFIKEAAHGLDITDLAVTSKYTITVSSDGYVKMWDGKYGLIKEELINSNGIHHIAAFEELSMLLLSFGCFDGSIVFYCFNEKINFQRLNLSIDFSRKNLVPGFFKDPESKQHFLVVTGVNGSNVYTVQELDIQFYGSLNLKTCSLPISLSVNDNKAAIGYLDGDVEIYDLPSCKLIYKIDGAGAVRLVKFAPDSLVLAIARDQPVFGIVQLYEINGNLIGELIIDTAHRYTHNGWITGVSFKADQLVTIGFDNVIRIWRNTTLEKTIQIGDLSADINAASGIEFNEVGFCVINFDRAIRWYIK